MAEMNMNYPSVATALKKLRQDKGWSLTLCSEKTSVSKAMLGQIERNESSPTLATLWKLATGFDVSLSWLISGDDHETSNQVHPIQFERDGIKVQTLLPYDSASRQEVYLLTMAAGSKSFSEAHRPGTLETLYVVSGQLDIWIDNKWHNIKQGYAFRFKADQQHGYRNTSDRETVFHDVISYP